MTKHTFHVARSLYIAICVGCASLLPLAANAQTPSKGNANKVANRDPAMAGRIPLIRPVPRTPTPRNLPPRTPPQTPKSPPAKPTPKPTKSDPGPATKVDIPSAPKPNPGTYGPPKKAPKK
jgi:hypothetical protein